MCLHLLASGEWWTDQAVVWLCMFPLKGTCNQLCWEEIQKRHSFCIVPKRLSVLLPCLCVCFLGNSNSLNPGVEFAGDWNYVYWAVLLSSKKMMGCYLWSRKGGNEMYTVTQYWTFLISFCSGQNYRTIPLPWPRRHSMACISYRPKFRPFWLNHCRPAKFAVPAHANTGWQNMPLCTTAHSSRLINKSARLLRAFIGEAVLIWEMFLPRTRTHGVLGLALL